MRLEWNGKKPLTKIKALYICWKLWEWLAETGEGDKEKWPGWKKVATCDSECPCCQYMVSHRGATCGRCLMIGLWPLGCCTGGSPFSLWDAIGASKKERKKYALIIANFAKKEYLKEAKKSKRR